MSQKFPLAKKNFEYLDIPNLLINVWEYNDKSHLGRPICSQYKGWCIEILEFNPELCYFAN